MVRHRLAEFDRHKHCGRADIMVLVCQAILKEHVIKAPCNLMGRIGTHQDKLPSC